MYFTLNHYAQINQNQNQDKEGIFPIANTRQEITRGNTSDLLLAGYDPRVA